MKLTRRNLAQLLTVAAAAAPEAAYAQAAQPAPEADDAAAARKALNASLDMLAKTPVPIATEPAAHFKA